mmetsp:Transcript_27993/g.43663  ORF Transcript_27993/g.43663 Transcript_27993/m.43663 type:complete len:83 (-) Transcript_27993:367-615(-)
MREESQRFWDFPGVKDLWDRQSVEIDGILNYRVTHLCDMTRMRKRGRETQSPRNKKNRNTEANSAMSDLRSTVLHGSRRDPH